MRATACDQAVALFFLLETLGQAQSVHSNFTFVLCGATLPVAQAGKTPAPQIIL
jgi:hypothetical protein